MFKALLTGFVLCFLCLATPVQAFAQTNATTDTLTWISSDYAGVGAIDMQKFPKRKLFSDLMSFFVTDVRAKEALGMLKAEGVDFDKALRRIVVGVPTDVEKGEHILFWESLVDLSKYKKVLELNALHLDVRSHQGATYYATKRENECLAIIDDVLVLGSEKAVKAVLQKKFSKTVSAQKFWPGLADELKKVDKSKDAWFAYSLGDAERKRIGRGDPIIDMTSTGKGAVNLGDMRSGNFSIDFSKGLDVSYHVTVVDEARAKVTLELIKSLLADSAKSEDVKALGLEGFISGLSLSAKKSVLTIKIAYSQAQFDALIGLVTDLAKSLPGQGSQKAAQ